MGAVSECDLWFDFGIRVAESHDDLALAHGLWRYQSLHAGCSNYHIGFCYHRFETRRFPACSDERRRCALVDIEVDQTSDPAVQQQPSDTEAGWSETDLPDGATIQLDVEPSRSGDQRSQCHDGGPSLVVVQHQLIEVLDQLMLDLETGGRGDVLELNRAEDGRDTNDRLDDLVWAARFEADRHGRDADQLLEEGSLALHHRHRRHWFDVAEPEHGSPICDDRDRVLD